MWKAGDMVLLNWQEATPRLSVSPATGERTKGNMYYKEEYMNVRDLKKLEMENLSNGGRAILDAVGPSYEYRNG